MDVHQHYGVESFMNSLDLLLNMKYMISNDHERLLVFHDNSLSSIKNKLIDIIL